MKIVRRNAGREQAGVPPIYISKIRTAFESWLFQTPDSTILSTLDFRSISSNLWEKRNIVMECRHATLVQDATLEPAARES